MTRIFKKLDGIPSDIEIAQSAALQPVGEIARKLGIPESFYEPYGHYKGKVDLAYYDSIKDSPDGKLILVTAMTATRAGEGKTVTSIGLAQAFGKLNKNHMLCLREPSLGPTFGIKGGAAGGGYAQVLPMEDINMHFTGDMHAITAAHNLLAAVLDNHIHFGNELGFKEGAVIWRRVIDLCDRQLRNCQIGLGSKYDGFPHESGFDITASSEIMAILALSSDMTDLRERLERIIVGFNTDDEPVYARSLKCIGAMCVLLKDAIKPNLVQTLEHTPALIHCGPFANIAHGCNSVIATRLGLKMADYVITEAGFAADLGAEKFLHVKCRQAGLKPDAVVCVLSCRAMKLHGGAELESLSDENLDALKLGFENARVHIENMRKFGLPVVVAVNRFPQDSDPELNLVLDLCEEMGVAAALSEVAVNGGDGGVELAETVLSIMESEESQYHVLYEQDQSIKDKVMTVCREIYRADGVEYSDKALEEISKLENAGLDKLPLCIAKTQLSISDNAKLAGAPSGFTVKVNDIKISNGAGFIVVVTGKIMLMPGMPNVPTVEKIDIDPDGTIHNLA